MPLRTADYQQPRKPQNNKNYERKENPPVTDGDRFSALFLKFSKPFEQTNKTGQMEWRIMALYQFTEGLYSGQEYKEFLKLSDFDGKSQSGQAVSASTFFLRAKALTGCQTTAQCRVLDLESIFNIPVVLSFAINSWGNVKISSVRKVDQPTRAPFARFSSRPGEIIHVEDHREWPPNGLGSPPSDEMPEFEELPAPNPQAPTVEECIHVFLGVRPKLEWGAFLVTNSFGPWTPENKAKIDSNPDLRTRLMTEIRKIEPIEKPTLRTQAELARLDLEEAAEQF